MSEIPLWLIDVLIAVPYIAIMVYIVVTARKPPLP